MLHTKRADFTAIGEKFQISPVVARVMRNRGLVTQEEMRCYLQGTVQDLYSPMRLKDMDRAISILKEKIVQKKKIRIVGDYDIDGVCSTYLLYQGLTRCGARVDYQIPERMKDGYGINESIIQKAKGDDVDTIITCDNGIAASQQIQLAIELGMTVIITDHHEVPVLDGAEILPPAQAIVNPKQKDCTYPFEGICGGVVAYKLVQALYESYGISKMEWLGMLEFAAIATVGDVMMLQGENRIIVKWGLKQFPKTKSVGLRKLVEACNLEIDQLTGYHIGFVIGPCLNASGRLKTAKLALELLLCQEETRAMDLAMQLKELNEERKELTKVGVDEAIEMVETKYEQDDVLVVYLPDCHESLAGIIAGRIRERFHKPSFVVTNSEGKAKGSGRSIPAYHMYQGLCGVSDLLLKFGGHPMAAGFSLEMDQVDAFREMLNEKSTLKPEEFIEKIWIDVPMPINYISESLVTELAVLEPFGQGNEKPQFAQKDLTIRNCRVLGKNRNVVKLSLVTKEGFAMDGILFTDGDLFLEELGTSKQIDIIYYPDINEYNGNKSLQVVIRQYQIQ